MDTCAVCNRPLGMLRQDEDDLGIPQWVASGWARHENQDGSLYEVCYPCHRLIEEVDAM